MSKARESQAQSILARTSGFIAAAGFTHSLNPARNCTFGCTYCYVPTMRIYAGLQREDWEKWGQFTTFKANAADLLRRELRPHQVIYCSPLVDPYQPEESSRRLMPAILQAVASAPPARFVVQTRGPLILRDLDLLQAIPRLRVSFSLTTDCDDVRRRYEPHCATFEERLSAIRTLTEAGVETYATLAPLLPGDPEILIEQAAAATRQDLIADPLHIRATKAHGATSREAAHRVAAHHGEEAWFAAGFQRELAERLRTLAARHGRALGVGPAGFALLTRE